MATVHNLIDYVTIASTGNSSDFGDLSIARDSAPTGVTNGTRGAFGGGTGGSPSANQDVIDYINIASTGNASDFGDLTAGVAYARGNSDGTKGVWAGGDIDSYSNVIEYITISTTGNASDFGDLLGSYETGGAASGSAS